MQQKVKKIEPLSDKTPKHNQESSITTIYNKNSNFICSIHENQQFKNCKCIIDQPHMIKCNKKSKRLKLYNKKQVLTRP